MEVRKLTEFSMAIFAMEQRSRYNLERLKNHIEQHPQLRAQISSGPERALQTQILENLINIATESHNRHFPLEMVFIHSGSDRFIISDRPAFRDDGLEYRVMVLTNEVAVFYKRSSAGPPCTHSDASAELVDTINSELAHRARDWIVAETEEQLERYAQLVHSEQWHTNLATEQIQVTAPLTLSSGWAFRVKEPEPGH